MAGAAVSADDSFFLGFGENVHHALIALRPVALGEAVHQANVEIIGAKFAAETIEVGASGGGIACPRLRENSDFVAGHMLEGFSDMRMAAVGIGRIKKAQAVVVAVQEKFGETFDTERGLVGMMSGAHRAGAHGETAGLNAGLADRDRVRSAELAGQAGQSPEVAGHSRTEPSSACSVG